jgi:hypothetical protein
MDNYDTIIAGYMHPSMKQLISYDTNTNTGILYTSAWKPVAVFKVVKGKDVFQKSFEAYLNTTRCMNVVTLKNVIDYANANFERSMFSVGECNGSYEYPSQPFVLRVATLTVSEYETFCD